MRSPEPLTRVRPTPNPIATPAAIRDTISNTTSQKTAGTRPYNLSGSADDTGLPSLDLPMIGSGWMRASGGNSAALYSPANCSEQGDATRSSGMSFGGGLILILFWTASSSEWTLVVRGL